MDFGVPVLAPSVRLDGAVGTQAAQNVLETIRGGAAGSAQVADPPAAEAVVAAASLDVSAVGPADATAHSTATATTRHRRAIRRIDPMAPSPISGHVVYAGNDYADDA